MRNNETGEFELVVGNKQLLSGFFIVVLLFAVAFAMGYVVGQNTQRPAKLASEGGAASNAAGTVANTAADSRPQPSSPVAPLPVSSTPAPPDAGSGQQPTPDSPPQPTTQPAQGSQPPAVEKAAAAPAATGIVAPSELPPGSFWQVIAVKPEMAEAIRQTLKDKGFQVALTPGTSNLMRVLVGPYDDVPSLGRARTALEAAGFHPARYKRD
ncbi:MAG: SPOR domain-containing protein [Candidatus Solibacter sp.]|nr:SPOR domain-containing protein [Candidatus Solibacter sp.]